MMMRRQLNRGLVVVVLMMTAALAGATGASANLQLTSANVGLTDVSGDAQLQAGAHPDFSLDIALPRVPLTRDGYTFEGPPEALRDLDVDLPAGFTGNPAAFATCSLAELQNQALGGSNCPVAAQVGYADVKLSQLNNTAIDAPVGVYNLTTGPEAPAQFGFNYDSALAIITARVRPEDYGISSGSFKITQTTSIQSIRLELWGVPADPVHDAKRQAFGQGQVTGVPVSSPVPPVPFLTNPTSCSGNPLGFTVRADSWENPGQYDTRTITTDSTGLPLTMTGCSNLAFTPSVSVQPLSHTADAPTGLDVGVTVPQNQDPDGLTTPHVRKVAVTFPQGMSVSPSSAAGLGGCSTAEIGLGTNDPPSCPGSSKIGTVTIDTPLLSEPLEGEVLLASQGDNPFQSLLALYIVAQGPGFYLKLPGRIDLDRITGQLTATFDNTPQLPFSKLHMVLQGGSQAPLATPATCGVYTSHAEVTSWASETPVALDTPMEINEGCATGGFAPAFSAGVTNPIAGSSSPFTLTFSRQDGEQDLSGLTATMPPGLIGDVASVPLCPEAQAAAGTCSAASRVGYTTILSGSGAAPISVPMAGKAPTAVYLAGPYKGAPFSLSIVVPAQAGPFDLGTVVVRAALFIDKHDSHITVVSDPLPTILQGIPLRIRQVTVVLDRPGFMLTPTSCAPSAINATISSTQGASAAVSSRFQVADCANLPFKPVLTASTAGRASKPGGASLDVKIASGVGQANIASVKVDLPKQLPSRLTTLQKACLAAVFDVNPASCPAASNVGTATAITPVLGQPLSGPAYLVSHGGAAFPDLEIVLQGEGVTLILDGNTSIKKGITSSTFKAIPDAPIKSFELKLPTGKYSALGTNLPQSAKYNLCGQTLAMPTAITAQNGASIKQTTKITVTDCPKAKTAARLRARKLAAALKVCHKKKGSTRARCERQTARQAARNTGK